MNCCPLDCMTIGVFFFSLLLVSLMQRGKRGGLCFSRRKLTLQSSHDTWRAIPLSLFPPCVWSMYSSTGVYILLGGVAEPAV
ncbi:hypothetical protein M441DRAFT_400716 [Trichoderma asperellum CBS 433.97]|uniref:Secreted protein n=1 Tax=Trichoderma asperellum (strain ATCC 204424 / CBS 433.97 / NBRC 101777) TaxID=1042311 RepID=A0A2T3Z9T5_TRIA4|nr:hypothetical protein M441DRAFT_400716 [Trichoderma asperellum CBS 433.97]PTB41550.1 hypothetical protein M441DRAFT_400716 [Trichoderma asperellum CBS 433.97]